jgi:uncharacterized membrane protein YuzA (DUF378 family)
MPVRVKYYKYTFNNPSPPLEESYNYIKQVLESEYKSKISEMIKSEHAEFIKRNKFLIRCKRFGLIYAIVGFAALMVASVYKLEVPYPLNAILYMPVLILVFAGLSGIIETHNSFKKYLNLKKKYYYNLKKEIDGTSNYKEYIDKITIPKSKKLIIN